MKENKISKIKIKPRKYSEKKITDCCQKLILGLHLSGLGTNYIVMKKCGLFLAEHLQIVIHTGSNRRDMEKPVLQCKEQGFQPF